MKLQLGFRHLLLCCLMTTAVPAFGAQAVTKIIMTSGSFSEREAVNYVAQDQGFFRRYGLEMTFVIVRNGPVGMAALASGETQFHSGSATGAVLGSAAEGMDMSVRRRHHQQTHRQHHGLAENQNPRRPERQNHRRHQR